MSPNGQHAPSVSLALFRQGAQDLLDASAGDRTMFELARCLILEELLFKRIIPRLSRRASGKSLRNTDALRTLTEVLESQDKAVSRTKFNMPLLRTVFKLRGLRNLLGHGIAVIPVDKIPKADIVSLDSTGDTTNSRVSDCFLRDPGGFLCRLATSEIAIEPGLDSALSLLLEQLFEIDASLQSPQGVLDSSPHPTCGISDDPKLGLSYEAALEQIYTAYRQGLSVPSGHAVSLSDSLSPPELVMRLLQELWAVENACRRECMRRGLCDGDFLITARQVLSDIPAVKKGRLWVQADLSGVLRLAPDPYDLAIDVFLHPRGLRVHELVFHDPVRILFSLSPRDLGRLAELAGALRLEVGLAAAGKAEDLRLRYTSRYSTASQTLAGLLACARLGSAGAASPGPIPQRVASLRDRSSAAACVWVAALVLELEERSRREDIGEFLEKLPLEIVCTFLRTEYTEVYGAGRSRPDVFDPVMKTARASLCALRGGPREKALKRCEDLRSRLDSLASKLVLARKSEKPIS